MSKLSNALGMLDLLSQHAIMSREALANALEISPRAVQRLKDDIELAGYEISSQFGIGGGYRLEDQSQIKPRAFNVEEIRVLKQALSFLMNQDLSVFGDSAPKTLAKLSNQLNDYGFQNIEHFQSIKLNVDPLEYRRNIQTLEAAIQAHQRLIVTYQKNHRERNVYTFEPYDMVIVNKFWYLRGIEKEQGRFLSLKINRINHIEALDETFRFDEQTLKDAKLSDFGYKIRPTYLKCILQNKDYLSEYIWGEQQSIIWLSDHSFQLEVTFPNENAAKDFILQNGASLEIIEPQSMIEWHKQEVEKIMKRYGHIACI